MCNFLKKMNQKIKKLFYVNNLMKTYLEQFFNYTIN
jgi:hypothetical protein